MSYTMNALPVRRMNSMRYKTQALLTKQTITRCTRTGVWRDAMMDDGRGPTIFGDKKGTSIFLVKVLCLRRNLHVYELIALNHGRFF